jgi:hypothetical protein
LEEFLFFQVILFGLSDDISHHEPVDEGLVLPKMMDKRSPGLPAKP